MALLNVRRAHLQKQGHDLAIFHRGTSPVRDRSKEIRGDRNELMASADELRRFAPEIVDLFFIKPFFLTSGQMPSKVQGHA
jgi:hypothetical protein